MWSSRRFAGKLNNVWRCGTIRDGIQTHVTGRTHGIQVNGYVDSRGNDRFDIRLIKVGEPEYSYSYYRLDDFTKKDIATYTAQDIATYFPNSRR
jgi:hypothetical protein|tara:strand:+ start:186 stop:467 length:282 start_codon:yes stop_codon:yes gene_type:complete